MRKPRRPTTTEPEATAPSARAVRVLVARPQPGAAESARALEAAGAEPVVRPVLELRPLDETPTSRSVIQDLDRFDLAVVVSPAAANVALEWVGRYWPQLPLAPRWIAVGARTRAELARAGIDALAPPRDERSEGVLALEPLADVRERRVLMVRGEGGRNVLAEALEARGAQMTHLTTHRRVRRDAGIMESIDVDAVSVTSVEVLEAFAACLDDLTPWRSRVLIVPSERVAAVARRHGFEYVDIARGAGPDALLAALRARFGVRLTA